MEFGGGLGRFISSPPTENLCREIVEVPGGPEWKIRKLEENQELDKYCWKYPGSSVIVNYQFNRLQTLLTPSEEEDENEKMFYAKVSHFMSPLEISLQPKYLSSARKSIMNQLNEVYQWRCPFVIPEGFTEDQIFVPVACAVQELGIWYRGRICQISGEKHVVVELVDFGTQILVNRDNILPLLHRFGRVPPLCLKCKTDRLSINDLEIKDLHEFKNIVTDCNATFRVEIKSIYEPFLVDLYHPTISGLNVCEKFFPPPDDIGKMDRYERNWEAHCKKMNEEFDDDEDDFSEEHDGDGDYFPSATSFHVIPRDVPREKYVKRLPKCQRAPRFEQDLLLIEHIENSQLIYLQYQWHVAKRVKLGDVLRATWHHLPRLPSNLRAKDQICAIRNPRFAGGIVCRGVIIDEITVLLVDYGRFVKCPKEADLRLLPANGLMMDEPMVTVISLTRGVNALWPHHSETQFLRQKLPRGTQVHFKWDKKSKQTPLRGKLIQKGRKETLNDQMVNCLKRLKIDGTCRQLDIYRPRENHVLPRGNHVYHATCHPQYSKGMEEFLWI